MQFSQPYAAATIVLYGKTGTPIKSAADLKGLRVGVARASTQDVAVTKAAPEGTEIRRFDDDASAMQALMSGQVDAIGCLDHGGRADRQARAGQHLREQVQPGAAEPWASPCGRARTTCSRTSTTSWPKNTANGELNKLYQKWLQTDLPKLQ